VRPAGPPSAVVSAGGVQLRIPTGWHRVHAASDAPVTDPRTLLVVGTGGVHAQASRCQIGGKYHVPGQAAVVVVVGWISSSAGGGPGHQGRAALDHLTSVRRPIFECYPGRGAAAQVRLDGRDYQVNVMVGDRASQRRISEALAVARSFNVTATGSAGRIDPDTSIDVTGAIGGIHAGDPRTAVERRLGAGMVISTRSRHQPKRHGGNGTLTTVRYPASQLVVLYVARANRPAEVFSVTTSSPRYHTAVGLRVGSTLAQAQHEPGIRCTAQPGYVACQGGLGYEKPVTSFTVKDGRVVRVSMAAVAD